MQLKAICNGCHSVALIAFMYATRVCFALLQIRCFVVFKNIIILITSFLYYAHNVFHDMTNLLLQHMQKINCDQI